MTREALLGRLAEAASVVPEFWTIDGEHRRLSGEGLTALLQALRLPTDDDQAIERAIEELAENEWRRPLPPVLVLGEDEPPSIPVTLPAPADEVPIVWQLEPEEGQVSAGQALGRDLPLIERREVGGHALERRALVPRPSLPIGYYTLRVDLPAGHEVVRSELRLIVAPRAAWLPPRLAAGGRSWGSAIQLYAVRSRRNWGIGDFTDLERLVELAVREGAAVVGVNPLHALFLSDPERVSPYAPSSRLLLNPLYIDVERIPEFGQTAAARELVNSPAFQQRLASLRAAELVDYAGVTQAKLEALKLVFAAFTGSKSADRPADERQGEFQAFRQASPPTLGAWAALQAELHADPAMPAEFFCWLQWQAAEQLGAVRRSARERGLEIGLYLDLAIGTAADGIDVHADPELFATGASVGAPPDPLGPLGQDWNLPPVHPQVLRARAYAPFSAMLQANMRYAGAIRIDHILALMRLYWIPRGRPTAEGGYVNYPLDDLLGIVALESHRNRCLVVGEDLGTIPPELRRRLAERGILAYRVLYFERDETGRFRPPDHYPHLSLATVSTHDLATLPGFWDGRDIEVREGLGLYPAPEAAGAAREARGRDKALLLEALREAGAWPSDRPPPERFDQDVLEAAYGFLAQSPAMVLMMQFEDVLGVQEQPNLPGTIDEHPNWRRKLPVDLEDLAQDERLRRLATRLNEARNG